MTTQKSNKVPRIRFRNHASSWRTESVSLLLSERNIQAPKSELYPLMAFIAGQGVAPKGARYNREFLVSDELNKKYKQTEYGDFIYSSNNLETGSIGSNKYGKASISPVYSIFAPTSLGDSDFIEQLLCRKPFINEMVKWRQGVIYGQWRIHESDFLKIGITFPEVSEQRAIGAFLRTLDQLIARLERRHSKLAALKRTMLQKMFPHPDEDAPTIRFKAFSGKWGEASIEDAMENIANNSLSRANLNYRSGSAKNVHYGDVLVKFGEVLDAQSSDIPLISSDSTVAKLGSSSLKNGDIVMADAAEDEAVGKCTELHNIGSQIIFAGLHTIALRPKRSFAPFFLGYYLNSDAFHEQLIPIMQGTKVLSISRTAIRRLRIRFPHDEAEQRRIGKYFYNLDMLIRRHASQTQKLQQIKSAFLANMFV